jgi:hypothetical protein
MQRAAFPFIAPHAHSRLTTARMLAGGDGKLLEGCESREVGNLREVLSTINTPRPLMEGRAERGGLVDLTG